MRASRTEVRGQKSEDRRQRQEIHISGAEGLYEEKDVSKVVEQYVYRALSHSRGRPDRITITLEEIKQRPKRVRLLPITTSECGSPSEAKTIIFETLTEAGISEKALNNAFKVLMSKRTMRGASLISAVLGLRREPDRDRGTRATRLGMDKELEIELNRVLSGLRLTSTVKEALVLASKVASCRGIIAEICISDDPDYTTGYIASKKMGYWRIPNIKKNGDRRGGRVFFVEEGADVQSVIDYLEKVPVIITGEGGCRS